MNTVFKIRKILGRLKRRFCIWENVAQTRHELDLLEQNMYYEFGPRSRVGVPKILSLQETLRCITKNHMSIWRYGDGEFRMMLGKNMGSQCVDLDLGKRLREIATSRLEGGICALPNIFGALDHFNLPARRFWRDTVFRTGEKCLKFFNSGAQYGDACISRPSQECPACGLTVNEVFNFWKQLVKDRDVLIVEGRFSRLGVGNDLFSLARSIERVWCPAFDAFSYYEKIFTETKSLAKGKLILIALGATATVLAYDLCKAGFWAIDAGHVDVEYMWWKMGAKEKVPIPGRYVGEVGAGHELKSIPGEVEALKVVRLIGCE